MAARRVSKLNVDWNALGQRIPNEFRPQFINLRGRVDANLRKMLALPEQPPAIDWAFYKNKLGKAALVDSFQKKYESLQIPFPADTVSAKIAEHEKEISVLIQEDVARSNANIKKAEADLAYRNDQLPIVEMTYQEFAEAYPSLVVDAIKDPTPWPHDAEEIKGYKERLELIKSGKAPVADHDAH